MNSLFGEKKITEGLSADTTDLITGIQFDSGLIIYDTPGGGGDEKYENITRAFLGLPQLEEDLEGNKLLPRSEVPYKDINVNQWVNKSISDFESLDLIIFIVSVESSIRRGDLEFFQAVASTGKPIIVAINKTDLAEDAPDKIRANIEMIERKMRVIAIPVSARTRKGLEKLASAIHHKLPLETSKILGETVDSSLKNIIRYRQVEVDTVITAIKVAHLLNKKNEISDIMELSSYILGLYSHIVNQYRASDLELKQVGVDIASIWNTLDDRMSEMKSIANRATPMTIFGVTFGAFIATISTGGIATIPIAIGVASGLGISGTVGITSSILHRSKTYEKELKNEIKEKAGYLFSDNKFDITCSILAFGHVLRDVCEKIEKEKEIADFSKEFEKEYEKTQIELESFCDRINNIKAKDHEDLMRDIVAQYFTIRKNETFN